MLTAEMLEVVSDTLATNLTLLIPVGLGIFATIFGVKLVPKIIAIFRKG